MYKDFGLRNPLVYIPYSNKIGMCKNSWCGPECNHLDREQHGKLEDNVDIKPGSTWDSIYQKRNIQGD